MLKAIKSAVKASRFGSLVKPLYVGMLRLRLKAFESDKKLIKQYLAQQRVRKLQLGCGPNILDGWLNSDYFSGLFHAINLDATGEYPFENETFDYIFSEHMIEHFSFAKGQIMLKECFRVLRDGGKLRISTPDLAFLVALYQGEKSDLQKEYIKWSIREWVADAPFSEDTFVINNFVRNWGHTFIYDEKILRYSLESAGFKDIVRCRLNESRDELLCNLEHENRLPPGFLRMETLTLEATKKPVETT